MSAAARPLRGVPRVLAVALPGSGWLLRGRVPEGLALLAAWGLVCLAAVLGWGRVVGDDPRRGLDVTLAVAAVPLALLVLYGAALRHERRRARAAAPVAGYWDDVARRFGSRPLARVGLGVVGLLYLAAVLAPLLAPYEPQLQLDIVQLKNQAPSAAHWFGTDGYSRDLLSRVLYGARISLSIGLLAAAIAATLGTAVGAAAGYAGRWVDGALMRVVDMMFAFPRLVLLLVVLALVEHRNIYLVVVILALTGWMDVARLVRGQVLSLREQEYVLAARALGLPWHRIVLRHLIPNALAPVLVSATLMVGNTILIEAGLSFLGLGVPPPTAAWGSMVDDGQAAMMSAPWIAAFPGAAIVTAVVAINLVGDGLRDALDPRSS